MNFFETAAHYDLLIDENNDPVHDGAALRAYMDKWDGETFVNEILKDGPKRVLEIGVGSGRLAVKIAPHCKRFVGIDLSPKTVAKAKENLSSVPSCALLCGDFLSYPFTESFDVVYSSLTFFHIRQKQEAVQKAFDLLRTGGKFVLSVDKNQSDVLDYGSRKIRLYPDNPLTTREILSKAGFEPVKRTETEAAYLFFAEKNAPSESMR